MEQVLIGGNSLNLDSANTAYSTINGESPWNTVKEYMYQVVSPPGTLSNLHIELSAAPGAGTSYIFTILKNDVATAITVTVADAATSGQDDVNTAAVVEGDYLCLRCVPSAGPPAAAYARWTSKFTGTNAKESAIFGVAASPSKVTARYFSPSSSYRYASSTQNNVCQVDSPPGKIRDLIVKLSNAPGSGSYTLTLYVNAVISTLTVSIADPNTTGSDTVNEVAVVAGDRLEMKFVPIGSPANVITTTSWGMTFVATTDGESPVLGGVDVAPSTAADNFNFLQDSTGSPWNATEANRHQMSLAQRLKNLYVWLNTAPGAGKSYTFTVMKNGVATTLVATVSEASQTGNDITHTVTVLVDDDLSLKSAPSGTPAASYIHWGLVGYPTGAPPPAAAAFGLHPAVGMLAIGR